MQVLTPTSQHQSKEIINSDQVNETKSNKVTEMHPEKDINKTINGSLKLEHAFIDLKKETTELKMSNRNEMPLHVSSLEDMMNHKNLSSSAETLEDTTSYIYRTGNRRNSFARRDNKILADERDIKKELHQKANGCGRNEPENDGQSKMGEIERSKQIADNRKTFRRQFSVQTDEKMAQKPSFKTRSGSLENGIETSKEVQSF